MNDGKKRGVVVGMERMCSYHEQQSPQPNLARKEAGQSGKVAGVSGSRCADQHPDAGGYARSSGEADQAGV